MTVEGGLDEPEELEPEQGTLRLADAEDRWTSADWERAAAAVLRKARRLGEDDPDDLVWERLTRETLDGIGVTPLGTPALLADVATAGRPTRAGEWDIRAPLAVAGPRSANEEALVDLQNGVTSLWVQLPADADAGAVLGTVLAEVLLELAPVVVDAPEAPVAAAQALLALLEERGVRAAAGTNL